MSYTIQYSLVITNSDGSEFSNTGHKSSNADITGVLACQRLGVQLLDKMVDLGEAGAAKKAAAAPSKS